MITPIDIKDKVVGYYDSRIGGRKENQDSAGYMETESGCLVVVCDGMGGMQGGSVASDLAKQTILEIFKSADKQEEPSVTLIKAIRTANMAIIEKGESNSELRGMGTTVTALLITPNTAIIAHVGDSRVYQLRNGKKVFRTFDHSMVFEMVKRKVITEEQARLSAQSNIIMRALGIKPDIEVEISQHSYKKGDVFVLCTDGFWGAMPEEEFIKRMTQNKHVKTILEETADAVETIGRDNGGEFDNLTAAILKMNNNSLKKKKNKLSRIITIVLSVLLAATLAAGFILFNKDRLSMLFKDKLKTKQENSQIDTTRDTVRVDTETTPTDSTEVTQ